jgi:hypothetical protein
LRKWGVRVIAAIFVASLVLLSTKEPRIVTRAAEMLPRAYFPIMYKAEPVRLDDFEDQDPVWQTKFFGGPPETEGSFFYRSGLFVAEIRDNSANNVAWPGWRPQADFKLEVDARFADEDGKWLNGLGLIFGGNDDWTEYYAFMLSYNFAQHYWTVARVEPRPGTDPVELDYHWLLDTHSGWGGTPPDVGWYRSWNHLEVVRVGDQIDVYVNGFHMPNGTFTDGTYGRNRLVGLLATSHELNEGEVEFDNFRLTPLSMP